MNVLIAVDTNLLATAEGIDSPAAQARANALLDQLLPEATFVPVQVLGELFGLLVRKGGRTREHAHADILRWGSTFRPIPTTEVSFSAALDLAARHQLQIWDAIILAAAASAGCTLLLSEDFQHGFAWGGVTVVNPFATPSHPLLASIGQVP